ncbi:hypothetical protein KoxyNG13_001900 [Klebsiella pasteurii]
MILSEKVVTASILDASIFSILSTASAPIRTENDGGIMDLNTIDSSAVSTAAIAKSVALNQIFRDV